MSRHPVRNTRARLGNTLTCVRSKLDMDPAPPQMELRLTIGCQDVLIDSGYCVASLANHMPQKCLLQVAYNYPQFGLVCADLRGNNGHAEDPFEHHVH